LYQSWFCPFAQRAWIGVLEKGIDFDLHEVDPYNKSEEWLKINPKGLVPVIIHKGRSIWESGVILEYLDDVYPDRPNLLPNEPFLRAQDRMWVDHTNKKIIPSYMQLLMGQTDEKRKEAAEKLLQEIQFIFDNASFAEGPFLSGDGHKLGLIDIYLAPFGVRIKPVLGTHRHFEIPSNWSTFHKWVTAIKSHPSVQPTCASDEKLIEHTRKYAENTAQSELATAIRTGTAIP
uniref:Uncharacterized protein n=1 Tax=Plectus sambesii TaxID=2011161 RepID=A0A914ULK2_9BILA